MKLLCKLLGCKVPLEADHYYCVAFHGIKGDIAYVETCCNRCGEKVLVGIKRGRIVYKKIIDANDPLFMALYLLRNNTKQSYSYLKKEEK